MTATDFGYRKLDLDDDAPATATAIDDEPSRLPMLDEVDIRDTPEERAAWNARLASAQAEREPEVAEFKSKRNVFLGEGDVLLQAANLADVANCSDAEKAFRAFREANGIDWTYSMTPAPHPTLPGQLVENKNWITRDDLVAEGNAKAWGPFSDSYGLTQLDAIDKLAGVLIREDCKIRSMLSFDLGGSIAITAQRESFNRELPSGGTAQSLTTIVDSKDGSWSLRGAESAIDPICRNTLTWALLKGQRQWRMPHTRHINERLDLLANEIRKRGTYADALVDRLWAHDETKIHLDKVVKWLRDFRKADEQGLGKQAQKNRNAIVDRDVATIQRAPGCVEVYDADASLVSFYGLDQWASFTSTHLLAPKAVAADEGRLLEYSILGNGAKFQQATTDLIDSWWQEEATPQALQRVALV